MVFACEGCYETHVIYNTRAVFLFPNFQLLILYTLLITTIITKEEEKKHANGESKQVIVTLLYCKRLCAKIVPFM